MLFNLILSYCDAPEAWQYGIQDPATPAAEGMIIFHNYLVFFMCLIGIFVYLMLYEAIRTNSVNAVRFSHSNVLEIVWTIIPAIILVMIAVPSFSLLYSLDEIAASNITLKIIGHQWYWSYEYSDYMKIFSRRAKINFDSYMVNTEDLPFGSLRLLEVDNRVILPIKTHIRLLITSSDVIHSWAVPSFGIKLDATPGRLSQTSMYIKRIGVFYGQCSEICGINHGFMPIVVRAVRVRNFTRWFYSKW
jgi:cytochrome c oxidase subunit 2